MGFEPYVALEQQKLQGVKESIFRRLKNSEYFLFLDFKREGLIDPHEPNLESGEARGSLFFFKILKKMENYCIPISDYIPKITTWQLGFWSKN